MNQKDADAIKTQREVIDCLLEIVRSTVTMIENSLDLKNWRLALSQIEGMDVHFKQLAYNIRKYADLVWEVETYRNSDRIVAGKKTKEEK